MPALSKSQPLSPTKRALRALKEMRAKLEALERAGNEPIAVIGMGCRFPGGGVDPRSFWELLRDGVDAITEMPAERWDVDALYDPDPGAPGKMYFRQGGFLAEVDAFDSDFFGIAPREAKSLDPRQRLLLEVAWEALEDAGIAPSRLAGSPTGVYVGLMSNDYARLRLRGEPGPFDPHLGSGTDSSFTAGRLSYFLGLRGPSMAVATACSSSLVAAHLACQALRAGECDLALAGGVNLMLSPDLHVVLSRMGAVSKDGRCKTFDAAADGYGRGEGCGVVVLKRLSDALADGDRVLAAIRGSAVNHDGASGGLLVPNGPAQESLLRKALAAAGVDPRDVGYVEAHGTGTVLGDPIEVQALAQVLGGERDRPLLLGSVKTNVGHLEAAAGVAGLIKVVLSLRHREIPPHLHLKKPNPHIPWQELPFEVPLRRTPWPAARGPRIAGVSSFGLSGVNAHLIVEEAPAIEPPRAAVDRPLHLLTLSARTEKALRQLAGRYEGHLAADPAFADTCFTAGTGRSHFPYRLALAAASAAEAREKLTAVAAGRAPAGVFRQPAPRRERPAVAFLFTGQGCLYPGMGRQLYDTQPTFRRAIERCEEILRPHLKEPLTSVLYPEPDASSSLAEAAYAQPVLFAVEHALAELWRSWGVEPAVVLGHSVGEYAAACLAGVLSLEDGLRLVAVRGRLMQELSAEGAMVTLEADLRSVEEAIRQEPGVCVAAVNGPRSVVVSGQRSAVEAIRATFARAGVRTEELEVSHAFHSPLTEPMLADFARAASQVAYAAPRLQIVSNLTGGPVSAEIATPEYWRRHVREPVRFADGMESLARQGCRVFVEIGPKPVLSALGRQCLPEGVGVFVASLRPGRPDHQQLLESLGRLYVHGVDFDGSGFDRDYPRRRVALPTYPFQRRRYRIEAAPPPAPRRIAVPPPESGQETGAPSPVVLESLERSRPHDRRKLLRAYLHERVAQVLGFEEDRRSELDLESGFFDLGMDSFMAVELRRLLEADLGRSFPPTLVFTHPNLRDLSRYLLQSLWGAGTADAPTARPRPELAAGGAGSDVAILGMSGRFPGSGNLEAFWRNLRDGVESISFFSQEELAAAGVPEELRRDVSYVPAWGLLEGAELFDAEFFGMSPREARRTDPQHRIFLECSWEALEDAGYDPRSPRRPTGVFAGAAPTIYGRGKPRAGDLDLEAQIGLGKDFLPTRVSYKLDLKGPSLNVQTACSTALVAVHLACRSLQNGECDLALAGGVTIVWPPRAGYPYTEGGILSPDGRCRTFDAQARGSVFGNGAGVVVLKRLPEALADGDRIRAVIRGSAINNDGGEKVGYTAPGFDGQTAVIREAQARAGVAAETISYVEAHGTGTPLGDPMEVAALTRAFLGDTFVPGPPAAGGCAALPLAASPARIALDPPELRELVRGAEASLERQLDIRMLLEVPGLKPLLDELSTSLVYEYLAGEVEVFAGLVLERRVLRERLCLVPELHRHLDLFLRILEEDGVVRCDGESVRFLKGPREIADSRELERKLRAGWPEFDGLLRLQRYVVESFPRSLTGEVSPVEVLHPDGTNQLVEEHLREADLHEAMPLYRQLLIRTVAEIVAAAPQTVRILEAGAGTGILTWPLLDALEGLGLLRAGRVEYCFTDIGQVFLRQAREKALRLGYEGLDFRRFDVTGNPVDQGFEWESFDLVLGLNSLHVGSVVEQALRHLAALLAPGGWILGVELTRIDRWIHLIDGLEPGWWEFEDDIRAHSLFLDHRQWEEVLTGLGLEDVAAFPREAARRTVVDYGLLLARKPVAEVSRAACEPVAHGAPDARHFCALGSVKTNIGHLGMAAGAAGLIKTVLALERREIPPSLHFERPNPAIGFAESPFYVNRELRPWPSGATPRRAGVSSFGIGGTNAHLVLEEAPPVGSTAPSRRKEHLLVLSARTPEALLKATDNLAGRLRGADLDLADVAFTLQVGRTAFPHRRALVCGGLEEAVEVLATRAPDRLIDGRREEEPPVAFLFPGQGTQYANMGRELYEEEASYRREVDACCERLADLLGRDLRDLLHPPPGQEADAEEELARTAVTQPALFVVEYALARLWMEWGVRPQAMIGHSLGEYVAACLAGVMTLEDALVLVARRGQLVAELPPGAMLAVPVAAAEAAEFCGDEVTLAVDSAAFCCILAGPAGPLAQAAERMSAEGIQALPLNVSHAFHSPLVEPILERFAEVVRGVPLRPPRIPFLSNVTGTWATPDDVMDPAYWVRHLRETVRFAAGLEALVQGGGVLLEVGPGDALSTLARQSAAESVLTSLPPANPLRPRSGRPPERRHLLKTLGRLWAAGLPVDWEGFHRQEDRRRVGLPTYPFERQSYLPEAEVGTRSEPETTNGLPSLYVPSWSRTPLLPGSPPGEMRPWWVFADEGSLGSRLAERLVRSGRPVVRVERGRGFERLSGDLYTIDPAVPGDYRDLCRDLGGSPPERVLHLWNLAEPRPGPLALEDFERAQEPALYSLLFLMQAWQDAAVGVPLRLVVVANGLLEVTGEEELCTERASLLAACRVLPWEYREVSCRLVDVPGPKGGTRREARTLDQILHEAESEAAEPCVAYRGPYRWVQDFRKVAPADSASSALRRRGVYLVTDGLGDVGYVLARTLAGVEARLVVVSSTGLPPREGWDEYLAEHPYPDRRSLKIRRCRALEEMGAEVLPLRADVTCPQDMRRAVEEAEERFGVLHGVVHAAGATVDPLLGSGNRAARAEIRHRSRTKVAGALVLAELFQGREVDFVVLTSSLAPFFGRVGAAGFAAADLFLDAFARSQSQAGQAWTSVGWDRWQLNGDGGQLNGDGGAREGETLRRILTAGLTGQVLVSAGDFARRLEAAAPRREVREEPGDAAGERPAHLETPFVELADPREREIAGIWGEWLGVGAIGSRDNFFDLGGDSLVAVRVLFRLHRRLGARLSLKDFFEAPTVGELAALVAERQGEPPAAMHLPEMVEGEI